MYLHYIHPPTLPNSSQRNPSSLASRRVFSFSFQKRLSYNRHTGLTIYLFVPLL